MHQLEHQLLLNRRGIRVGGAGRMVFCVGARIWTMTQAEKVTTNLIIGLREVRFSIAFADK